MQPPLNLKSYAYNVHSAALDMADLHPDTQSMLIERKSHPKALEQSQKGRLCAQCAVETLTGDILPILTGPSREPLWPEGLTGSITHTEGYIAAIAAPRRQNGLRLKGLGFDAENVSAISMDILHKIAAPREQNWILGGQNPRVRLAQIFSMKEALFKALNPETGIVIGFLEIELMIVYCDGGLNAIITHMSPRVNAKVRAQDVWLESRVDEGLSLATALWVQLF